MTALCKGGAVDWNWGNPAGTCDYKCVNIHGRGLGGGVPIAAIASIAILGLILVVVVVALLRRARTRKLQNNRHRLFN